MDVAPFTILEPETGETAVVVEVPHAGIAVPARFLASLVAPARSLARDADLYVDDLYADAPLEGATLIVAHLSRYVVDLNRSDQDVDEGSVVGAGTTTRLSHGLVWRLTTDGERALLRPLSQEELTFRLDAVHRPYHAALRAVLERKRQRFGFAILLAAHSMPSVARAGHGDAGNTRADVVPGTRGGTSAGRAVIDVVDRHARGAGLSVRHDDPYRGGYTTLHYGRPEAGVHAIQVELARRLYMDETTLLRAPESFEATRTFCRRLVAALGKVDARG